MVADESGGIHGDVSGTGTFSPGNSPGILTINGNFSPTGTVTFEVNSPYATAGTDYDQYVVSGTVNYTVETEDDPLDTHVDNTTAGPIFGPGGPVAPIVTAFAEPQSLTGQSTNQAGEITRPINAWRITLNSGSGSATATAIQGGIKQ